MSRTPKEWKGRPPSTPYACDAKHVGRVIPGRDGGRAIMCATPDAQHPHEGQLWLAPSVLTPADTAPFRAEVFGTADAIARARGAASPPRPRPQALRSLGPTPRNSAGVRPRDQWSPAPGRDEFTQVRERFEAFDAIVLDGAQRVASRTDALGRRLTPKAFEKERARALADCEHLEALIAETRRRWPDCAMQNVDVLALALQHCNDVRVPVSFDGHKRGDWFTITRRLAPRVSLRIAPMGRGFQILDTTTEPRVRVLDEFDTQKHAAKEAIRLLVRYEYTGADGMVFSPPRGRFAAMDTVPLEVTPHSWRGAASAPAARWITDGRVAVLAAAVTSPGLRPFVSKLRVRAVNAEGTDETTERALEPFNRGRAREGELYGWTLMGGVPIGLIGTRSDPDLLVYVDAWRFALTSKLVRWTRVFVGIDPLDPVILTDGERAVAMVMPRKTGVGAISAQEARARRAVR